MSDNKNLFVEGLSESSRLKSEIVSTDSLDILEEMGNEIIESIKNGGKLLICGNGGSAADAQHLAAELLVRLRPTFNRDSIPALSLCQIFLQLQPAVMILATINYLNEPLEVLEEREMFF